VGKVVDSLALVKQNVLTNPVTGTGTTNYVPKFTGTSTIGNSSILDGGTSVTIAKSNASNDVGLLVKQEANFTASFISIDANNDGGAAYNFLRSTTTSGTEHWKISGGAASSTMAFSTGGSERMRIMSSGNIGINTTTDAGYTTDISGTLRNTGSAYFATTTGLIGIGTTSPTAKLEVVSPSNSIDVGMRVRSAGTGPAAFLSVVGNTDAGAVFNFIQSATNNGVEHWRIHGAGVRKTLAFRTDTIERARIDSNGNFAISTTAPTEKLDVNGRARIRTIDSTATAMNMLYVDANGVIKKSPIIGSQQVGIGIAAPTSNGGADAGLVHVHTPTSSAWSVAHFTNGTTGSTGSDGLIMGNIGNEVYFFNYENSNIRFYTNSIERTRITGDGELLLNTTTDAGDYKLQVSGNAYVTGTTVLAATSGNVGIGTTSTPTKLTVNGTITAYGDITTGGGSASVYSVDIGAGRTGNGFSYIDLIGDETYTDYGLRIIRNNTGANSGSVVVHRGTGDFTIVATESANLSLQTANNEALRISSSQEILINTQVDAGNYKLQTNGNTYTNGTYTSAAPTDGTARPWKFGDYVTTAPTATGFVQVEINGVKYKLLAATY
jgi:hypothetical protein